MINPRLSLGKAFGSKSAAAMLVEMLLPLKMWFPLAVTSVEGCAGVEQGWLPLGQQLCWEIKFSKKEFTGEMK